ncbi:hypothetical protein A8135_01095 [Legionella jamestowniensis]|uniref:Aminoglycoside phosphotransferase domain-containing protein n=1 Tax=Legionella jamestowniensis TaxID=455 RepID=A0ABX2XTA9_9GAMM|nr:phosphotransferase [Legionella jamestowniensis]OCH97848.1 hypothetical protein A8135_01095 [Legionella jamestowniensis]
MNNQHWSGQFFKHPIRSIVSLKGGQQHQTDLIELYDGSKWVCKILNNYTWLGAIKQIQLAFTEDIATYVAQELNCTFAPLKLGSSNQQDNYRYLIVPYCSGKSVVAVKKKQAMKLGRLLAKLHGLSLTHPEGRGFPLIHLPNQYIYPVWLKLLVQRCNELHEYDKANWIISHRDMHLQNIIWKTATKPHLIDWESAGFIHPFIELIGLAINCSGLANCQFDKELFQATLLGYLQQKGKLPRTDNNLWEMCFHSWLLWYNYSLEKGCYEDAKNTLQAIELIKLTMPVLKTIYAEASDYEKNRFA